ncbi:MAG: SGNH/GDSL hydrolase family protein [Pedobacter sp.]|nr:SGNH/GDSL hydrolase family protein [Pedobacter sp.]MDQ8053103.1 SGNH/GDSL hydrolase family protein [Pedobacter sp.]
MDTNTHPSSYTYLALGDSYTIGEAVAEADSFPFQLVALLGRSKLQFARPKVIATTGWTTSELAAGIKAATVATKYDLVTLLIGVNNQYRGQPITVYRKEFKALLKQAIGFAGGNAKHVFVVSIPDWGVTPFAMESGREPETISAAIDTFNAINKAETLALGVSYIDITPGSRLAKTRPALLASDGLHPSGKMYAEWAKDLAPQVARALRP